MEEQELKNYLRIGSENMDEWSCCFLRWESWSCRLGWNQEFSFEHVKFGLSSGYLCDELK